MNKQAIRHTAIDGYRVELIPTANGQGVQCVVTGEILRRELSATLDELQVNGRIMHMTSRESHEVDASTVTRITAWAAQYGYEE